MTLLKSDYKFIMFQFLGLIVPIFWAFLSIPLPRHASCSVYLKIMSVMFSYLYDYNDVLDDFSFNSTPVS